MNKAENKAVKEVTNKSKKTKRCKGTRAKGARVKGYKSKRLQGQLKSGFFTARYL